MKKQKRKDKEKRERKGGKDLILKPPKEILTYFTICWLSESNLMWGEKEKKKGKEKERKGEGEKGR